MAFSLPIPPAWRSQGWKVKIRDKERVEPPHATIVRGTRAWRLSLRTGELLDHQPDPDDVPEALVAWVSEQVPALVTQWDAIYPENPVDSTGDIDE